MPLKNITSFLCAFVFAQPVFAGGAVNVYQSVGSMIGVPEQFHALIAPIFVLFLIAAIGLYFRANVRKQLANPVPGESYNLFSFVEGLLEFVVGLSKEQCGKQYKTFLPLLGGLFIFILFNNLSGLIPGFPPITENFSANLAMGAVAFIVYNGAGVKEHGIGYLKHFMGPFLILAPLFLVLETISHAARPLSLAFRLTANIFGDHLLLGVFSGMVPFGVPALIMCFGLLIAFIQSFVFTVLTGIYIGMAISHDH